MIDRSQPNPSKHELPGCTDFPVVIGVCVPLFVPFIINYEKGNVCCFVENCETKGP